MHDGLQPTGNTSVVLGHLIYQSLDFLIILKRGQLLCKPLEGFQMIHTEHGGSFHGGGMRGGVGEATGGLIYPILQAFTPLLGPLPPALLEEVGICSHNVSIFPERTQHGSTEADTYLSSSPVTAFFRDWSS